MGIENAIENIENMERAEGKLEKEGAKVEKKIEKVKGERHKEQLKAIQENMKVVRDRTGRAYSFAMKLGVIMEHYDDAIAQPDIKNYHYISEKTRERALNLIRKVNETCHETNWIILEIFNDGIKRLDKTIQKGNHGREKLIARISDKELINTAESSTALTYQEKVFKSDVDDDCRSVTDYIFDSLEKIGLLNLTHRVYGKFEKQMTINTWTDLDRTVKIREQLERIKEIEEKKLREKKKSGFGGESLMSKIDEELFLLDELKDSLTEEVDELDTTVELLLDQIEKTMGVFFKEINGLFIKIQEVRKKAEDEEVDQRIKNIKKSLEI